MSEVPTLVFTPEKTLEFEASQNSQSHVSLKLENPHSEHVAFKIKTTAPKSYLVKPSSGVINPRESVSVNILLVPMYEAPKVPVPDRFLIQTTFVQSSEPLGKDRWAAIPKHRLDEKKMAVTINWLAGDVANLVSAAENRGGDANAANPTPTTTNTGSYNRIVLMASKPMPGDYNGLKQNYDELLALALTLERQHREVMIERDQHIVGGAIASKRGPQFELWQMVILMVLTIAILKLTHLM